MQTIEHDSQNQDQSRNYESENKTSSGENKHTQGSIQKVNQTYS